MIERNDTETDNLTSRDFLSNLCEISIENSSISKLSPTSFNSLPDQTYRLQIETPWRDETARYHRF